MTRLRAVPPGTPATVRFISIWPSAIGLSWIDSRGKPERFADVGTYRAYSVKTYAGQPWVATDDRGRCIAVFVPQQGDNTARIFPGVSPSIQ